MSFSVKREVVGPRKRSLADGADERSIARVFAEMSCQLVRPREAPATVEPLARVRLFTGVRAVVSGKMRTLRVHLAASGHRTAMNLEPRVAVQQLQLLGGARRLEGRRRDAAAAVQLLEERRPSAAAATAAPAAAAATRRHRGRSQMLWLLLLLLLLWVAIVGIGRHQGERSEGRREGQAVQW